MISCFHPPSPNQFLNLFITSAGGEVVVVAIKGAFACLACMGLGSVGVQGVRAGVLVAALVLELVVVQVEWLLFLSSMTTLFCLVLNCILLWTLIRFLLAIRLTARAL